MLSSARQSSPRTKEERGPSGVSDWKEGAPAPVLQLEAAEAARQPQTPQEDETRPKAAQSSSSDVQIIEETGIGASSLMPAPALSSAMKQEAPTKKCCAKPAVEPSGVRPRPEHVRMQPRRSCTTGAARTLYCNLAHGRTLKMHGQQA